MTAPRIFISHSSQDADFTRDLAKALAEAGADVWYLDQHDRGPIEIGLAIERELRERNVFVVVLSQDAIKSGGVEDECHKYWRLWHDEQNTRFILPVAARDFDISKFKSNMPYLIGFKRVEQGEGVALPWVQTIQQTLLELGLALAVGDYRPDVVEAIRLKYVELGAIASGLGMPRYLQADDATKQVSQRGTEGYIYPFQHGVICWCEKAGAHPMWHGVYEIYTQLRSQLDKSALGFALTDELIAAPSSFGTKGIFQRFESLEGYPGDIPHVPDIDYGASVYWSERFGAHATKGAIGECYERLHGTSTDGHLGFPISDELDAAPSPRKTEGKYQEFEGGTIYWCSKAGAHPVRDKIREFFHAQGGTRSRFGFPVTDELPAARSLHETKDAYQYFEGRWDYPEDVPSYPQGIRYGATIYYSARGTHATLDGIGACYERVGGTNAVLGFPTSSEQDATPSPQGTVGRYQTFEGGSIHWCEKYHSVPITGRILDIYNQAGGSGGAFGFPIAAEETTPAKDGRVGRQQRFEGGIIYIED